MPTYDYVCRRCGAELEIFQPITAAPKRKCPRCQAFALHRRIGAGAALLFRGSGFYATDYRSASYKAGAKAAAEPAADKAAARCTHAKQDD
ncbi:MAG: zinc ribbon domain-containing protein [Planctomycetes bacterium]|nr:zinc ribbon domain-containing protein [Planctomycetota bacterium]